MPNIKELDNICTQVRRDIVRMVHANNSGHPGGSLGCTELFVSLYFEIMNHSNDFTMDGKNEDIFFLSNGHISPVFYSTLARSGYFEVSELKTFRKLNSRLQGHPTTHNNLEGIRMSSGSLGQGLSVAIGAAITKKLNKDNSTIFTLLGDGELQEGQNWEAIMYASANNIDNIITIIDYNQKQIDGSLDDVLAMGDIGEKFRVFGWEVITEKNGNSLKDIINTLKNALTLKEKGKPIVIILHTEMGNGVDFMMNTHKWHGSAPNDEQLATALSQNPETLGDY
jgi:transketolase|tara:strand:+ start:11429 stop:12274 length:846 start_codon:yes stop_codon:yes gene_type:complete